MNYNPLSLFPLPPQVRDPKPTPSALAIDGYADILWVGSAGGLVSAFASPLTLTRNVQFPALGVDTREYSSMPGLTGGVRQIRLSDREVWTLAEGGVAGRKRGGAPRWSVADPSRSLRAMTPSPTNSHEVLAGGTGQMMLINTARGDVVRKVGRAVTVLTPVRLKHCRPPGHGTEERRLCLWVWAGVYLGPASGIQTGCNHCASSSPHWGHEWC